MKYATAVFMFVALSALAWGQNTEAEGKAALADQKACSDQAAKLDADEDNEWGQPRGTFHVYASHYDPAANACNVMFFDLYADEIGEEGIFSRPTFEIDLTGFLELRMGHIRDCTAFMDHIQECTTFSPNQVAICSLGRLPVGDCFKLVRWAAWLCARREQPPYEVSHHLSYAEEAFCGADGFAALAP